MKWDFVLYLRSWIGFVGLMAIGNTIQCFWDHQFLASRLYTASPNSVNGLAARLFGVWTLLAGILRIWCAIFTYNQPLYDLTLFSFALAFLHFASEVWVFKTAQLSVGVMAPLIISGISFTLMAAGYRSIFVSAVEDSKPDDAEEFKDFLKTFKSQSRTKKSS